MKLECCRHWILETCQWRICRLESKSQLERKCLIGNYLKCLNRFLIFIDVNIGVHTMDSGHNKDTIQGVHNVSGVTVTASPRSYNPPTRHRWLHSSHTSDERWPSKVMSWPRKEFQSTTIVWRSDASIGQRQRQPTTFVCSIHCWVGVFFHLFVPVHFVC